MASALGPGGRRHPAARRGMPVRARLVLVALLLVPVVEIGLLIAVGHLIGGWPTIAAGAGGDVARRLPGQA